MLSNHFMDKTEFTLQWKIARFGFFAAIIGALIGGTCTFAGSYFVWNQQQKTLDEQKLMEQQNMATALYFDVFTIETKFNSSMNDFLLYEGTNALNNPNSIYLQTIDIIVLIGYIVFLARISRDLIVLHLLIYTIFMQT
jgi:hypothetical protein